MQELLLHGLDTACIASITADSAAVNMGEYGGVVTRMSKLLQSKGQAGCIRAQPCYSHGILNTLLAGLAALGGDIRPAIESIASLLAQYWVPLGMGAWGAKPQVPCDTRWASYISSTVTMLRVWAHARDAVSQLLERQKGMSPPWAVTLSQLLQDNSLLLRLSVVAVVGESFLVPELMWARSQITDAAHKVGRVVINVGDHACQQRLAAAHALALAAKAFPCIQNAGWYFKACAIQLLNPTALMLHQNKA
ncbi:hypothetical protein QJQ45_009836 [Haematococcus lacustris]|nr:hypothetical protein QJQ45_009835 [Haematococcus lacustris]KAJ9526360.1 hypothetical protein QJQ45_009836 [Haematococcus lacustris]